MPGRKNAGKPRPKKSPNPAEAPFGESIPPSPPHFMLDDHIDDVSVTGSPGLRSGSSSPTPSDFNLSGSPEQNRSLPDHRLKTSVGTAHTVTPAIASETSVMDQIAQAVRYIYPSSQGPSQRDGSKRRPVSFSSFLGSSGANKRANVGSLIATSLSPLLTPLNVAASRSSRSIPELTSEDDDRDPEASPPLDLESIIFSTWASLPDQASYPMQFLILGYEQGFQIWDTTHLDTITELVHIKDLDPFNAPVFGAALIFVPNEGWRSSSRLVAVFLVGHKGDSDTSFVAYCMETHEVIYQMDISGAVHLEVSTDMIAISTIKPPAIHTFSSQGFSKVQTFANVASRPAFALSGRLLAFASPPPTEQDRHKYSKSPVSARSAQSISPLGSAYKVGHGILSGMRTLGSIAAAATSSSRVAIPERDDTTSRLRGQNFSRSAPAASLLGSSPGSGSAARLGGYLFPSHLEEPSDQISHEGTWLTVVDLLAKSDNNEIHRFKVSGSKPITRIQWGSNGSTIYCSTSSGQTITVYSVRPESVVLSAAPGSPGNGGLGRTPRQRTNDIGVPWHIYDLHRGHSSANILNIVPSHDARWVAAYTQRGTVHIFATNPYGGTADISSHIKGKVTNPEVLPPLSTSLLPLLRIRPSSTSSSDVELDPTPSAMKFLTREESLGLPSFIAPPAENGCVIDNFQDLLIFQPVTGILELFRITVNILEQNPSSTPHSSTRTSRTTSPRVQPVTTGASALTRLIDKGKLLKAKESSIASWGLRRQSNWPELQQIIPSVDTFSGYRHRLGDNWLAYAEIDTFSKSSRILPPSIYISHQFTFHSFMEDYEALLRSERFNIPTVEIPVRDEVQVSAYATDVNDSLMRADDYEAQRNQHKQRNAVLDDPMATAISEDLETQSPPTVYPMLPNGASLSSNASRSFLEAIPIRRGAHIAMEGVGEGLGKLRREIAKVRSPSIRPVPDTPMEIQELEDEELLDVDHDAASSRMTSEAEASIRTPEGGREDRELADPWNEWGPEDQEAVAEAERFDEIYPAGVMDEDCEDTRIEKMNGNGHGHGDGNGGNRGPVNRRVGRKSKKAR